MKYSKASFEMNNDSDSSSESSEEEIDTKKHPIPSSDSDSSSESAEEESEMMIDEVASSEMNEGNACSSETSEEEANLCEEWKNLTIDDEIDDWEYILVFKDISRLVEENKDLKDYILYNERPLKDIQNRIEYLKMTESQIWIEITSSDWYKNALNLPNEIKAIEESATQRVKEVKSVTFVDADKTERTARILELAYKKLYFEETLNLHFEKCEEKSRQYLDRTLESNGWPSN